MPRLSRSSMARLSDGEPRTTQEIVLSLSPEPATLSLTPFDLPHYRKLIDARGATLRTVVRRLAPAVGLASAVDAGCGVGFFSQTLAELGLVVCGFDGRTQNIAEARRRFPAIPFETGDVQDRGILGLGRFDLVLCFGLLYHVENPLQAVRHLRGLTGKCLLLESMCVPGARNGLLLREEPEVADQGLTNMACYPSESGLVKMLYRAGFANVYRIVPLPDHDDFRETKEHARRRTVLLASLVPVDLAGFRLMPEPPEEGDPWSKMRIARPGLARRFWKFAKSPARAKYVTMALRVRRRFPQMAIPLRLPFRAWWLAEGSALDEKLLHGEFETGEIRFLGKLIERGMTAVDVGAHHGLHTLLASRMSGKEGRVLAFEPSARERARLGRHLRLNRCKNVRVFPYALGKERMQADFYVVEGQSDFCNSLRIPDVAEAVETTQVEVRRLDQVLEELEVRRVDFVKIDAEGAELVVLEGAERLLERRPRPVLLVEVEDRRTRMWDYAAREIIEHLEAKGFRWHCVTRQGQLQALDTSARSFEGNYVAVPTERMGELKEFRAEERKGERA